MVLTDNDFIQESFYNFCSDLYKRVEVDMQIIENYLKKTTSVKAFTKLLFLFLSKKAEWFSAQLSPEQETDPKKFSEKQQYR